MQINDLNVRAGFEKSVLAHEKRQRLASVGGPTYVGNDNSDHVHNVFTSEEIAMLNDLTRPYVEAGRFETVCGMGVTVSTFVGNEKTPAGHKNVFSFSKTRASERAVPEYTLNMARMNGLLWEGLNFSELHRKLAISLDSMYPGVIEHPKEAISLAPRKIAAPRLSLVS